MTIDEVLLACIVGIVRSRTLACGISSCQNRHSKGWSFFWTFSATPLGPFKIKDNVFSYYFRREPTKKGSQLLVPFSAIILPKTTPFSTLHTILPNEHLKPQTTFRTSNQTETISFFAIDTPQQLVSPHFSRVWTSGNLILKRLFPSSIKYFLLLPNQFPKKIFLLIARWFDVFSTDIMTLLLQYNNFTFTQRNLPRRWHFFQNFTESKNHDWRNLTSFHSRNCPVQNPSVRHL